LAVWAAMLRSASAPSAEPSEGELAVAA
jgi:hypothetical protein